MYSTMRDKKGKEVYQKGTAFRSFAQFEEPNLGKRDYMEDGKFLLYPDSFVIDCFLENCPKSALIGMFDGHGGNEVSRFLVKTLPQV